jgi:hypothetical protein
MCETDATAPELPSRILARIPVSRSNPVAHNLIPLCDYVTSDESARETEERFQALLALAVPKSGSVDGISTGLVFREDSTPLAQQATSQKAQQTSQQSNSPKTNNNSNDNTQKQTVQVHNQQKNLFLPIVAAVVVAIVGVIILLLRK